MTLCVESVVKPYTKLSSCAHYGPVCAAYINVLAGRQPPSRSCCIHRTAPATKSQAELKMVILTECYQWRNWELPALPIHPSHFTSLPTPSLFFLPYLSSITRVKY